MLDLDLRSEKKGSGTWLLVVGLVLLLIAGALLAWWGFSGLGGGGTPAEPTTTVPQTPLLPTRDPNATPVSIATLPPTPTYTPIATLTPTPEPPSPTPAVAYIIAGADGANVRTGPGTVYTRIGYINPGGQAMVIGRYGNWWEIMYQGGEGWVFGDIVTAYNVEDVPEVVPPPVPTAAPVPPTAVPPTAAPAQPTPTAAVSGPIGDARGLVASQYELVGGAGPYAVNQSIPYRFTVCNQSSGRVYYSALGTWVEGTDIYRKSYFTPLGTQIWFEPAGAAGSCITNHLDGGLTIPQPGTYRLWLVIQFGPYGEDAVLLRGPITITVQ